MPETKIYFVEEAFKYLAENGLVTEKDPNFWAPCAQVTVLYWHVYGKE